MLQTSLDKICFVVVKARAFVAQAEPVQENPGSGAADDDFRGVLAGYANDQTYVELKSFIDDLNDDEQCELVALAWLGRGDFGDGEWAQVVREARGRRQGSTADYLLGMPILPDQLEEGLAQLGLSCLGFEASRL
ncbi:MAG: DUF3775 domain-containing protein [Alphaproteobacteria bacterium]